MVCEQTSVCLCKQDVTAASRAEHNFHRTGFKGESDTLNTFYLYLHTWTHMYVSEYRGIISDYAV